jgi:Ca2+-binding EF-hand superfamily protein
MASKIDIQLGNDLKLTKIEMDKAWRVFNVFDKDDYGRIDIKEL